MGTLLTVDAIATLLGVHRSQVLRLVRAGMPCMDLSVGRPGRRRKRTLRFDREAAMAWLAERGRA